MWHDVNLTSLKSCLNLGAVTVGHWSQNKLQTAGGFDGFELTQGT